jgi:hypothetical protein
VENRRVIVPLKFSDGNLVRNVAGLKQKISTSPGEVLKKINGGELERLFHGLARDDLKELISLMRNQNKSPDKILGQLSPLIGADYKMDEASVHDEYIVRQEDNLRNVLESNASATYSFPRGQWQARDQIVIGNNKKISGSGCTATAWNIEHIIIGNEVSGNVSLENISIRRKDGHYGVIVIRHGKVSLSNVVLDHIRLELYNDSELSIENTSFIDASPAIYLENNTKINIGNAVNFDKSDVFARIKQEDNHVYDISNVSTDFMGQLSIKEYNLWRQITNKDLKAGYTEYLHLYPKGLFAQEAQTRINQRFGVSDLTIVDRDSSLMWANCESSKELNWHDAIAYAESLNRDQFAGYSDWRVPSLDELMSLNYEHFEKEGFPMLCDWLRKQGFEDTTGSYYWSSTTVPFNPDIVSVLFLCTGNIISRNKAEYFCVRCVRIVQV